MARRCDETYKVRNQKRVPYLPFSKLLLDLHHPAEHQPLVTLLCNYVLSSVTIVDVFLPRQLESIALIRRNITKVRMGNVHF